MKKVISRVITALWLSLTVACNYEPEGVNPVVLAPLDPENIDINLVLEDGADTVRIYRDDQTVDYYHESNAIQHIRFFINDQEIRPDKYYSHWEGYFDLDAFNLEEGIHTIKAEVTALVESNSLAGAGGQEVVTFYREWPLVLDTSPLTASEIISVEPYEGRLRVRWQPYRRNDFVSYKIYDRETDEYSSGKSLAEITDPTITE